MKSKVQRLIAAMLSVMMVTSLTACISKGDDAANDTPSKTESTAASGDTTSKEATIDPLGKYDPPITLTSVRSVNAENTFVDGDDINNNPYTRMLAEDLGITVKYDWVVDSTQWKTKVTTMLASNTMPDFFRPDSADFMNLAQQDAVMDMTQLYKDYSSELLKTHDSNFIEGYESGFVNGKHYGMADLGWGTISLPSIMWIRSDWLKNSGMEVPTTMEALNTLAKKFKDDNKGAYGLALDKSLTGGINSIVPIMNSYHAYVKSWVKKDGKIVYGSIQPEVKNGLLELQKMYAEGIIDKEFAVKDTNKVIEDITNNKVGITLAGNNIGFWGTYDCVKNNPESEWLAYDVPKVDDEPLLLQGGWPVGSYLVINKDCKNPEAVIKTVNLFCERFKDGTFNKPEFLTTSHWSYPPAVQTDPTNEYVTHIAVSEALETGDTSKLTPQQSPFYDAALLWQNDKDAVTISSSYGRYAQMSKVGAYATLKKYVDEDRILLTELRGATPEGYAKIQSTLDKVEDDTFTKIIMGAPISEFDKFVESWNKLGGEAATKEVNDTFNK